VVERLCKFESCFGHQGFPSLFKNYALMVKLVDMLL
jgi:hypothetical protein